jgi:hypothetical protein
VDKALRRPIVVSSAVDPDPVSLGFAEVLVIVQGHEAVGVDEMKSADSREHLRKVVADERVEDS